MKITSLIPKTLIVLTLLGSFLFTNTVFAETTPFYDFRFIVEGDQAVSPQKVVMSDIEPGSDIKGRLVLENPEDVIADYEIKLDDGYVNEEGKVVFGDFAAQGKEPVLGSWFEFSEKKVTLQPQEQRAIDFTVNVPEHAAPGDYVAGITMILTGYERIGEDSEGNIVTGSKASVTTGYGGKFLINVYGDTVLDVDFKNIEWREVNGKGFFIDAEVASGSNVSVRPFYMVTITDFAGNEVFSNRFYNFQTLYPGATSLEKFFLEGLHVLSYGRYKVNVDLYFETEKELLKMGSLDELPLENLIDGGNASLTIWLLPWMVMYVFIALLLPICIWLFIRAMKKYKKKKN